MYLFLKNICIDIFIIKVDSIFFLLVYLILFVKFMKYFLKEIFEI